MLLISVLDRKMWTNQKCFSRSSIVRQMRSFTELPLLLFSVLERNRSTNHSESVLNSIVGITKVPVLSYLKTQQEHLRFETSWGTLSRLFVDLARKPDRRTCLIPNSNPWYPSPARDVFFLVELSDYSFLKCAECFVQGKLTKVAEISRTFEDYRCTG